MIIEKGETHAVVESLRRALREGRSFEANQVRFIDLADVKTKSGAKWGRIAAQVQQTAAQFLQRRLAEGDLLIRAGDGFIVVFMDRAGVEARRLALQQALNHFYIGDEGDNPIRIQMDEAVITAEALMGMVGGGVQPETAKPVAAISPSDLSFAFSPTWNAAQEMIMAYWLAPRADAGPRVVSCYDLIRVDPNDKEQPDFLPLDLTMLETAVMAAELSLETYSKCLVGATVHATTMQNGARRRVYLGRLAAVPASVRPYLMILISEVDPGAPVTTLAEWVYQIRPFTPRVSVEVHATQLNLIGYQSAGLNNVATVLGSDHIFEQKRLRQLIQRMTRQTRDQQIRCRIMNINDPDLLAEAVSCGAEFVASSLLWPLVDAPSGVRRFPRASLLEGLEALAA